MADAVVAEEDDSQWSVVEEAMQDPEERRVLFSALDSFVQYGRMAHFNCTHQRRQAFYALPQAHWQALAAPPFNYLDTLSRVDEAIDSNAELADFIVKNGMHSIPLVAQEAAPPNSGSPLPRQWQNCAKYEDVNKARSTIRQFYRDWTAEGAAEREACYKPVLQALAAEAAAKGPNRPPLKVLVPGAGLGRLVFDLCMNGYEAEGNEISYHQLLASSYILNYCERAGRHTIYPWVHSFSNHRMRENQFRSYSVPDVHCGTELVRAGVWGGSMAMCASDFLCGYGDEMHADTYDAVACVFFLDTAPNLIRYLETIFHCLRPGGVLVNVGPLLWHFEDNSPGAHVHDDEGDGDTSGIADPGSFELSDDEVVALVTRLGFELVSHKTGVNAPYIHDPESMLQTVYKASVWVARKPMTPPPPKGA